MQNDLNRGEYKAHALMNIPPPLNVNAARKSNKKVENTISISVHQKVDSDSDADILNTEKKQSPAATKRKKSEEKIEERKEEKTEEETPKVIDLVDMDSDNQIRIDESQQNE
uniref:Uncharacterized protein n=1 Tax=Panagrolaimus sp. ES5 TaxID=591445 RepID=A0AC34F7J3_9BILA